MHSQKEIEGERNEDRTDRKADVRTDGGRREEKSGEWLNGLL